LHRIADKPSRPVKLAVGLTERDRSTDRSDKHVGARG